MLDVPEGALRREAVRVLATINEFPGTVRGLAVLSRQLTAHIANLEQFGLDRSRVRAVQNERATVEGINAVAMSESAQELSDRAIGDVQAALRRFEEVVRPLTFAEETG